MTFHPKGWPPQRRPPRSPEAVAQWIRSEAAALYKRAAEISEHTPQSTSEIVDDVVEELERLMLEGGTHDPPNA